MRLHVVGFVASCQFLSTMASAQTVEKPVLRPGDSWLFQQTLQTPKDGWRQARFQLEISRITSSRIYFSVIQVGAARAPTELSAGLDWSMSKSVNGKETVVSRPLDFPLKAGKNWKLELEEKEDLGNNLHKSKASSLTYQVIGIENIEVPAGKFKAWKIEAEGNWTTTTPPATTTSQQTRAGADGTATVSVAKKTGEMIVTGRIYKAVWYVPEINNYVKYITERFDSGGVRYHSEVKELVSFKEGPKPSVE